MEYLYAFLITIWAFAVVAIFGLKFDVISLFIIFLISLLLFRPAAHANFTKQTYKALISDVRAPKLLGYGRNPYKFSHYTGHKSDWDWYHWSDDWRESDNKICYTRQNVFASESCCDTIDLFQEYPCKNKFERMVK